MSKFNIKLQHLPGHKLILSDTLSRQPNHFPDDDEIEEHVVLPDNMFLNPLDIGVQEQIMNTKDFDFDVKNTILILLEDGPSSIRNDLKDWKLEDINGKKVLFYKGKVYVAKDQDIQCDILKLYHDHKTAGHPGEFKTYSLVQQ